MTLLGLELVSTPDDGLATETSQDQAEVEEAICQLVKAYQDSNARAPRLERQRHLNYLEGLLQGLPWPYTSLDASRPWLIYWITHSFALLGAELGSLTRQRAVATLAHCRPSSASPRSGFGGGPGQRPHLATTYAGVLALSYLGDAHTWGDSHIIDRHAMYDWLMSLKQADGSFTMHEGGEVDVRGAYCALTVATLLNILTPELMAGTAAFAASCQTYEGGLASSSHPFASSEVRPAFGEAHGGYAFCALAAHFMLRCFRDETASEERSIDIKSLTRWSAHMQAQAIEGGGFRGRTNKLVDGCYSWWTGGLWAMLGAIIHGENEPSRALAQFDREALQEYVLVVAQNHRGGLRDKPGKPPDAYHSCYNLSGLSAAQHEMLYSPVLRSSLAEQFDIPSSTIPLIKGNTESEQDAIQRMRRTYAHALAWRESRTQLCVVGEPSNELSVVHPVFNITFDRAKLMLDYFYDQPEDVIGSTV